MTLGWLTPDHIIYRLDERIDELGERAFPHNGHLHYYSSAMGDIAPQLVYPKPTNHHRAIAWTNVHGGYLIDHSQLGQNLDKFAKVGTFTYFQNHPDYNLTTWKAAAIAPWAHLSRHFAQSAWGYVSTTVCGSDPNGVFRTIELPTTIDPRYFGLSNDDFIIALLNPRAKPVEFVNLLPFSRIENAFYIDGAAKAFELVCLGEQRAYLQEAVKLATPDEIHKGFMASAEEVFYKPVEAYEFFLYSQECYQLAQKKQLEDVGAPVPKHLNKTTVQRKVSQEQRLRLFGAMAWRAVQTEVALLPAAARPNIIIPASMAGVAI